MAKDRTGSGKTLAFSLPIIMKMRKEAKFRVSHKPRFLIVLPTRYCSTNLENLQFRFEMKSSASDLKIKKTL